MSERFTLFVCPGVTIYDRDERNDDASEFQPAMFLTNQRHDVLSWRSEEIFINLAETLTINPLLFSASEWIVVVLEVVGKVKVTTVGVDYDGATPMTGITGCYGTEYHPGILMLSSYNMSSITLAGIDASSTVKLLSLTVVTPTDARL